MGTPAVTPKGPDEEKIKVFISFLGFYFSLVNAAIIVMLTQKTATCHD